MSARVLILSGDVGDGHRTAAHALATQLRAQGARVHVDEALGCVGRLQRAVFRRGSRWLYRWAPLLFTVVYRVLLRSPLARSAGARSLARSGAKPLLALVRRHRPDVIVSTHPAATVVLAALRRTGLLAIPAIATITDLAGLFFWAQPGIDLHLVNWQESVDEVMRFAPRSEVRLVAPLTAPAFFEPRSAVDARRDLGLPPAGRVVVVSGGGWAVGDLAGAVDAAAARPGTFVVCLAGRDERVRAALCERFRQREHVRVLGFTDRMSDLLAAADLLVHTTGGVTCLEASLRGCPIVLYGFPVGHVRHNAAAMERHGLVHRAATLRELERLLDRPLAAPPALCAFAGPDHASVVLDAEAAPTAHRSAVPAPRARLRYAAATLAVAAIAAFAATPAGAPLAQHAPIGTIEHLAAHLIPR